MDMIGKALSGVAGFAALVLIAAVLNGYPVMLALGVIHNDITPKCPALGLWACVLLNWGMGVLVGVFNNARSARKA